MTSQSLHIFKNDVRHLWREIALMVAIVVAYGWYTATHAQQSGFFVMDMVFTSQILALLVPVAFLFLIVRVVHGECPVGDRQFWITRPYDWRQLLAEKVLFVAAFVNLPFLLLQVFLLWHAGFSPAKYLAELIWLQVLWTGWVFLPAATLAAVTAGVRQFSLAVLGVLVYLVAFAALITKVPNIGVTGTDVVPRWIDFIFRYSCILAVILWQYAQRTTVRSCSVLLGLGVAVPALFAITPYRTVIAHLYPAPASQPPVELAFDPAKPSSLKGGFPEKNKVHIRLPLLISGVAEGARVSEGGISVSIDAPGGPHWESGWNGGSGELLADRPRSAETITLDKDFFERVKSTAVNAHLTYALIPSRAQFVVQIIAGPAPFTIPGDGHCFFSPSFAGQAMCFFPPGKTTATLLSAKAEEFTCKPVEKAKPLAAGTTLYGWIGQFPNFGLNPVSSSSLGLYDFGEAETSNFRDALCPGTRLTLYTDWHDGPRYRADLEIDGIHLVDYKLDDSPDNGAGGFGVMVP